MTLGNPAILCNSVMLSDPATVCNPAIVCDSARLSDPATPSNPATFSDPVIGGPVQDLSNFQMAPIPFLSDLTCSTLSLHDILRVFKNTIDHNLPVGRVKRDIHVLGGCSFGFFVGF